MVFLKFIISKNVVQIIKLSCFSLIVGFPRKGHSLQKLFKISKVFIFFRKMYEIPKIIAVLRNFKFSKTFKSF